MDIIMKKSVGAVIAASFLLIGQSAIYAKETGKPATLPTPSPKATSSTGQGKSQSQTTPAKPSTTTSPSPTKSQSPSAAANSNSNSNSNSNVPSTASTALASKKSSNSKLNPSATNAAAANAKAQAARNLTTTLSADCKPAKDGKSPTGKDTNLIPVRVLDCTGSGSYSSVISGLDWIAANYRSGDAAVVNMSLGGPASSTLDGAVRNLISKGLNVVVAAGNSSADACNYSPARVLDAITVGATANTDARASYSNYGTCLDLFAPGSSITSTWLGATGTNTISGTSMASPNVAGVVARFIGQYSGLTTAQVANSIKTSSTKNLVTSAGSGSPNQLAYLFVLPDTTTVAPVDSSPRFKKNIPRGRFK